MKLYGFGPTRSIRAEWALKELEVPYDFVTVNLGAGANKKPDYLAINPAGKVPTLEDGELLLTESIAIVRYLGDKYASKGLMPQELTERAEVDRWLMFAATELEQPLWRISKHTTLYPEEKRIPAEVPNAKADFRDMVKVFEAHIDGRTFILGDAVSMADFVMAYTLDWANEVKLLDASPRSLAYMERMYQRPRAPNRIAKALAAMRAQSS